MSNLNQKGFNSKKQLVIVLYPQLTQGIIGLIIGIAIGFSLNLDTELIGIAIIVIFIILLLLSLFSPMTLKVLFFAIGLILGLMIYLSMNIIEIIPPFSQL